MLLCGASGLHCPQRSLTLSIFPRAHWPRFGALPTSEWGRVSLLGCRGSSTSWILTPYQEHGLQILPSLWVTFLPSRQSPSMHTSFNLDEVQFTCFSFRSWCFWCHLQIPVQQCHGDSLPRFLLSGCMWMSRPPLIRILAQHRRVAVRPLKCVSTEISEVHLVFPVETHDQTIHSVR